MRPKGLTETEIKRIFDFDWNNSDDEEGAEEEELYDANLERVIEETIHQVKMSDIAPVNHRKRGRPSAILPSMQSDSPSPAPSDISNVSSQSSSSSAKRSYISEPPKSMRLDRVCHWVEWGAKGRCRVCQTSIPKSKCSKCKVYLCCNPQKNCFVSYHT